MKITLAGAERELADVEQLESIRSRSTGRDLQHVRVTFTVRSGDLDEKVQADLGAAAKGEQLAGEDDVLWAVGTWSYYNAAGGSPATEYTVELLEVEQVDVERLAFLGLNVVVEDYKDEADRGDAQLVMTAKFTTAGDEIGILERAILEKMKADEDYFEIQRIGVDDAPRRVRFGLVVWEDAGPGRKRWVVNFVEEEGDNDRSRYSLLNEPHFSNMRRLVLAQQSMINRLLSDLVTAGILPADAPASYAKLDGSEHELKLTKTRDVDLFY